MARVALRANLSAVRAEFRLRIIHMSRYPGQLLLDIALPILFAAMPIFLSRAVPADQALANFERNAGTANYVAYLLIGSTAFILVTRAFWDVAYWLRFEQQVGTLEAIYQTPTETRVLMVGVALYSAARGLGTGALAYLIGCLLFRVNPLQGEVAVAALFLAVGLVPVYAMALMFGGLVIRVRESTSMVTLLQWGISFLMGIYYPLEMLPPLARWAAMAFPPSWMVNGVRASLLGVGYFLSEWYLDLAVLWMFMLITPLAGIWLFGRIEQGARGRQGLGQY